MLDSKAEHLQHSSTTSGQTRACVLSTDHDNRLYVLPASVRHMVKAYLSSKELSVLISTYQKLFPPAFCLQQLLSAIVYGEPDDVLVIAGTNPSLLFSQGQVTDAAGQIFYGVSPLQLWSQRTSPLVVTFFQRV